MALAFDNKAEYAFVHFTSSSCAPNDSRCFIEAWTADAIPGATPKVIISAIMPIRLPCKGLLCKESAGLNAAAKSSTGLEELVASCTSCPETTALI